MKTREINISGIKVGGNAPLVLIGGPCVIEGAEQCMDVARKLKQAASIAKIPLIFKASYDKANRTSLNSFRGPGLKEGLKILAAVKQELKLPILTDVHGPEQCEAAAEVADVIQIPAFLCRQTDLLTAAGKTGCAVNVKKGQFLAPGDMRNVVEKIRATDNEDILITERGTAFGYHYLVNDMRALPSMRMLGYPIVFDATHSVQTPGGMGSRSGGERQFVPALARAAVACGVDAIFIEAHPDPDHAFSDGPNMMRIEDLPSLLALLAQLHTQVNAYIANESLVEGSRILTGRTLVNAKLPGATL